MKNNNIEIISGFKFAEISDVIFSGVFLKSQIKKLNLKENIENHIGYSEYVFVRKKKFRLKENQIIFCKTEYIDELFQILNSQCRFKNIKLITHQSDLRITKKIFSSKPSCISKWYSINVDFKNENLIPIPIGIANFHSKNLNETMFDNVIEKNNLFRDKDNLLYLNFNANTNFGHRKNLFTLFRDKDWVMADSSSLEHLEYKTRISEHNFTLAPWGNGIDTHRFWESLYSGSIPVTKKHLLYNSFNNIPKILVDDYKEITEEFLLLELKKLQKNNDMLNFNDLDFKHWKNIISNESINIEDRESQELINVHYNLYRNIADFKHLIKSKFKIFNRIRRLIYKMFKI
jgi:hypothetical protein